MHQRFTRLSANVRRKILAALVAASSAGVVSAEAPADVQEAAEAGPMLEIRLTRRPWLDTAPSVPSAAADRPEADESKLPRSPELRHSPSQPSAASPSQSSAASPSEASPSQPSAASPSQPSAASPSQPSAADPKRPSGQVALAGPAGSETRSGVSHSSKSDEPRATSSAERATDGSASITGRWVPRGTIGQHQPLRDRPSSSQASGSTARSAGDAAGTSEGDPQAADAEAPPSDLSPAPRPASSQQREGDAAASLEAASPGSAAATPRHQADRDGERSGDAGSRDSARPSGPKRIEPLEISQPAADAADADAEVEERLKNVVVRRLRVGRDGSLPGEPREPAGYRSREPAGYRSHEPDPADALRAGRAEDEEAAAAAPTQSPSEPSAEPADPLDYTGRPTQPLEVDPAVRRLQPTMRRCLQYYFDRPERAPRRSNWGMLHAIMVYGVDTPILAGRESYSAIAWIAGNNICRGKRLLRQGSSGIEAATGIGLQGHQAQMLAVFALTGVPADYPLYAGRNRYSVEDLVQAEAKACRSGEELTFSLVGLSHYLDTDATWTGADGGRWDFERLIREELSQPIVGSACGGTHRLMGFAHALRERRHEGRPIDGQWLRAEQFLNDFVEYTYQLQNRDGSMSTDWFEGREDNGDLDRKVQTTGHMVEFLLTVTPDAELQNPKLVRSIRFLLSAMYNERGRDWSIGPKGHALRSLSMYYQRVYGEGVAWNSQSIADSGRAGRR